MFINSFSFQDWSCWPVWLYSVQELWLYVLPVLIMTSTRLQLGFFQVWLYLQLTLTGYISLDDLTFPFFSKKNVYRCVMNEVALSCEQWCQIKGISSSGSIFADCKAIPWKGVNACPFFLIAFFLCFSCDVWLPDYLIFCYTDIFYDFIVDKYRRCHWSFKCWNLVNARECQFTWVSDRNFHYGEVRLFCVLLFVGMIVYLASTLFWTMIWKMVDLEECFFLLQENLKSGCYMLSVCQGVPLGSFDMFFILEFASTQLSLPCRWAMSSLTLKGKPSEQAPVASANSITPLTSTTSSTSSGMHLETEYCCLKHSVYCKMHV